jgi:geranylgeranyl diphosphate synthase type II
MDLKSWAAPRVATIEGALGALFRDAWPPLFGEMCQYPLTTGGKRMRPLLALAAGEAVAGPDASTRQRALSAAVAVELIHTYSLVHDDLPCMDDDDERRGHPTVHMRFGEGNALLVGDALLTEAFAVLARDAGLPAELRVRLVSELAGAAGYLGMIGGQARDVGIGGPVTDAADLERLHRGKTGRLIRAAVRMGAIACGADEATLAALTSYAEAVGLAFQLADDLLDYHEDEAAPSFPRLLGLEQTRARCAELAEVAERALDPLPHAEPLRALARFTIERKH